MAAMNYFLIYLWNNIIDISFFTNAEIYLVWVWPVLNGNDIILKING
jgi:hypothetical protein